MSSCLICGCVKNCEIYLDDVFDNIIKIQTLFNKSKIIISFDISNDFTLKKIIQIKKNKKLNIDIIINKNPLSKHRTINIQTARNKIIDKIYNEYPDYEYFIMLDPDDVCSKNININVLNDILSKTDIWDGLFFNNENYYDFWALSFNNFQYSCWHCNDPKKIINIMNTELKKELSIKQFVRCESAFGGFGIYKVKSFKNCYYRSQVDLCLINKNCVSNIQKEYNIIYDINSHILDCEHRYFHLSACKKNNARLYIYNKNLFPPYVGEHTNILDK